MRTRLTNVIGNKRLFVGADETGAVVLFEQVGESRPQPVSVQCGTWDTWVSLVESIGGSPSEILPVRVLGQDLQLFESEKALHAS